MEDLSGVIERNYKVRGRFPRIKALRPSEKAHNAAQALIFGRSPAKKRLSLATLSVPGASFLVSIETFQTVSLGSSVNRGCLSTLGVVGASFLSEYLQTLLSLS